VVEVGSADVMATLLLLKHEVEDAKGTAMRMIFSGAAEAHLIAEKIGKRVLFGNFTQRPSHFLR